MLTIRQTALADLPYVRKLLAQLGCDLAEAEVRRRYEMVVKAPDRALFVAGQDGGVIGLLHLYVRPALDKPPEVIVQALVVEETARGTGVGRKLMETAERWAKERAFDSVALTSQIARTEAHAFYERLGYRIEATSHLMRKKLAG
jgi:GNAT superfamily N-acetyltransferase